MFCHSNLSPELATLIFCNSKYSLSVGPFYMELWLVIHGVLKPSNHLARQRYINRYHPAPLHSLLCLLFCVQIWCVLTVIPPYSPRQPSVCFKVLWKEHVRLAILSRPTSPMKIPF
ncbi:hypothetical protein Ancab_016457 [Ancistrocladus abbreviatus]